MSEDQSARETPAPPESAAESGAPPAPPGKPAARPAGRAPLVLALIALVLAVALGVAQFFVWHEVNRVADDQRAVSARVEDRVAALDDRVKTTVGELETDTRRRVESAEAAAAEAAASVKNALSDLRDRLSGQADALAQVRAAVGRNQQGWQLAEVRYLLGMGVERLRLARDTDTALAALRSADRRLEALADPAYQPVRAALAEEIAALRAVESPDITGVAARLDGLVRQVDTLPLAETVAGATEARGPAADGFQFTEVEDWQRLPGVVWRALRGLVAIRHHDEPVGPMLAPEHEYFLRQNLRLQLESARLAALRRDPENYQSALQTAHTWLQDYYATGGAEVRAMLETLDELGTVELRPDLPDITRSLRLLREQRALGGDSGEAAGEAP